MLTTESQNVPRVRTAGPPRLCSGTYILMIHISVAFFWHSMTRIEAVQITVVLTRDWTIRTLLSLWIWPLPLQSVARAHAKVAPGRLEVAWGELLGANINRSPSSYLENPAEERARYAHDIDKEMTLLKVLDAEDSRHALSYLPKSRNCPLPMQGDLSLLSLSRSHSAGPFRLGRKHFLWLINALLCCLLLSQSGSSCPAECGSWSDFAVLPTHTLLS